LPKDENKPGKVASAMGFSPHIGSCIIIDIFYKYNVYSASSYCTQKFMSTKHYDIVIIGTGAGGGALAQRLAPSGKRILILERGTFLPQEKENWDTKGPCFNKCYSLS
jgi:lactate dehydrogenase-like 2-hydroxyacid dehydrogenase